jgi:hypothetical protein
MIFMAETKPSDDLIPVRTVDVENPQDFNTTYKDWQAVRIIRDNYFDSWRLFFSFSFWLGATLIGVSGYVIVNRPFQKQDAYLVGLVGVALILINLLLALHMFLHSRRIVENIRLILERTGDAEFLAGKVMNSYGAAVMAAGTSFGFVCALFVWVYVFFIFYPSRV